MSAVASKNPFAILDEDSSRPSTPTEPATPAPSTQPPAARGNQRGRGRGPASRGGKYYQRGGARGSGPRDAQPADEEPAEGGEKKFDREGRGRGRGRGGRGRGEGRGGRGRTFDRHSATGKTDSDKKIHQSWGGDDGVTELRTEEAATKDATVEQTGAVGEDNAWSATAPVDDNWGAPAAPADDAWGGAPAPAEDSWGAPSAPAEDAWGAPATDAAPAEGDRREGRRGREREPEEPDNTLTLDQYLQQQKDKASSIPKLEARKANEGADDAIWKGIVELQKKDDDENSYFIGKTKSAPKPRAKKEDKVFLEIEARFERPNRGGRGRGDRGERGERGERGGRGRGRDDRGGRDRANGNGTAVDVDDEKAFPSLS